MELKIVSSVLYHVTVIWLASLHVITYGSGACPCIGIFQPILVRIKYENFKNQALISPYIWKPHRFTWFSVSASSPQQATAMATSSFASGLPVHGPRGDKAVVATTAASAPPLNRSVRSHHGDLRRARIVQEMVRVHVDTSSWSLTRKTGVSIEVQLKVTFEAEVLVCEPEFRSNVALSGGQYSLLMSCLNAHLLLSCCNQETQCAGLVVQYFQPRLEHHFHLAKFNSSETSLTA